MCSSLYTYRWISGTDSTGTRLDLQASKTSAFLTALSNGVYAYRTASSRYGTRRKARSIRSSRRPGSPHYDDFSSNFH